jgi:hypothetical protein
VAATPLLPAPDPDGLWGGSIYGWSRGYTAIWIKGMSDSGNPIVNTVTTAYSDDGVHWQAGPAVYQPDTDVPDVREVYEGPAGLLAVEEVRPCGDSWVTGLLTSTDGVRWQAVDMPKTFGTDRVWDVSGGSTGFVATDTAGKAAWISLDGRDWQAVSLAKPAFARSRIDDGTAFSQGLVLVGSTELTGERSCGATIDPAAPKPPLRMPAVWWSSNGADWVKAQLPGAAAASDLQLSVQRLDDHHLAAFVTYPVLQRVWVSGDGRTWTPLAKSSPLNQFRTNNFCMDPGCLKTDGRNSVQIRAFSPTSEDPYAGGMWLSTWTGDGLTTLTQSGGQPPYDAGADWAVGPTGVVLTNAGRLWIGLPSSD